MATEHANTHSNNNSTDAKPAPPLNLPQWASKKQKNLVEWLLTRDVDIRALGPRTGPAPIHSLWKENAFIIPWAVAPTILQWAAYQYTGITWSPLFTFGVYLLNLTFFGIATVHRLRHFGFVYGYLDSKNKTRDFALDGTENHLFSSVITTITVRTMIACMFAYKREEMPNISWTVFFDAAIYMVILDYLYYAYHRSLHQVPFLWRFHKSHHVPKHPTALMAPYADEVQELFDIFLIPLAVYMIRPIPFHHLYFTVIYVIYVELTGHSGLRAYWAHPILGHVLRPFDMDLAIEDHDMHHRFGRTSGNFGKQTRIFDRIWGTTSERRETGPPGYIPVDLRKEQEADKAQVQASA